MNKEAAREKAMANVNWSMASFNGDFWFERGFDAGYKATSTDWVRITKQSDLPPTSGKYLVTVKEGGFVKTDYLVRNDSGTRQYWVRMYLAWQPMPEPFSESQPEGEGVT